MAKINRPSVEVVRQALEYRDGRLYWRVRPRGHFSSDGGWRQWNNQWSGNEAGYERWNDEYGKIILRSCIRIDGYDTKRSILVWVIFNGSWPINRIDHIDRNTLNDQINNLRLATRSQNMANSSIRRNKFTCKVKGVTCHGKNWRARIRVDYRLINIGTFKTPGEAHNAYMEAARCYFGEFACSG